MIISDIAKSRFLDVALSHLNAPYRWGGDDPTGFDCSGLVIECLRSVGLLPTRDGDWTANDLWHRYQSVTIKEPVAGCLVFWFNQAGTAYHVAICLDAWFCLTADGGGSTVKTIDDAIARNAFVKIRPIDHRPVNRKFINLFD